MKVFRIYLVSYPPVATDDSYILGTYLWYIYDKWINESLSGSTFSALSLLFLLLSRLSLLFGTSSLDCRPSGLDGGTNIIPKLSRDRQKDQFLPWSSLPLMVDISPKRGFPEAFSAVSGLLSTFLETLENLDLSPNYIGVHKRYKNSKVLQKWSFSSPFVVDRCSYPCQPGFYSSPSFIFF